MHTRYLSLIILIVAFSCSDRNEEADAYGNFEAVEIIVSSEVNGKLLRKNFEEGSTISSEQTVAIVDTTQLSLQRQELVARRIASKSKIANVNAQINVLEKEKEIASVDLKRIKEMFSDGAATQKQLDDITGKIDVLKEQIQSVKTNYQAIDAEIAAINTQIKKVEDLIMRSVIHPPKSGVVLQSYVEEGELMAMGKPILKMADLNTMELKAYVSGDQLSQIKIGQTVNAGIDMPDGEMQHLNGKISWISDEAEFTPKNIQTKKERVSQVYAFKVLVKNDGSIKINMPAEVTFN